MYRNIDENVVVLARRIIKIPLVFIRFFENRPFQKSTPKTMPKDLQNHPQIGPQFEKCLIKRAPKMGRKLEHQKVNFLSPKVIRGPPC